MDDDGAPRVLDELAAALAALPPLGGWVTEASCAQLGFKGADVFVAEGRIDREELVVARAVCVRCPVVRECGEYATRTPVYGLWGGRCYATAQPARRSRLSGHTDQRPPAASVSLAGWGEAIDRHGPAPHRRLDPSGGP